MSIYEIITICIFSLMALVWIITWVRFDIREKETDKFNRKRLEEWLKERKNRGINELEYYKRAFNSLNINNGKLISQNMKLEAVIKIIKEKNVDVLRIKITETVEQYNKRKIKGCKDLVQGEYDLLKEVFKK